jgi:hypothetical protein
MAWQARRAAAAAMLVDDATEGRAGRGGRPALLTRDFEPVMPSQWFAAPSGAVQPEKRLMLAVLSDAIELVLQASAPPGTPRAVIQQRAADWISSNDGADWLLSFVSICETLGFEPERLRQGVTRLIEQRRTTSRDATGGDGY